MTTVKRTRTLAVLVGAVALVAGTLAMAAPASGGGNGFEPPWPILRVEKTIAQAAEVPEGAQLEVPPDTVFTIEVTCEWPASNGSTVQGDPFPPTILTFDSTGAPKSADQGGWVDLGDGAWTFTGPELKYKLCSAVETDVSPEPNELQVAYKCAAEATQVETVTESETETECKVDVDFGCVRPLPEGEYESSPPATDAAVQFTVPWDFEACGIQNNTDVSAQIAPILCQETGTLTVDNFDPAWAVVAPAAIEIVPTFTG